MFGIKIHKIPSTKDNDNTNVLLHITWTMKSCDSENLVVCIVIMLFSAPRHIFSCLLFISFSMCFDVIFYFISFFLFVVVVAVVGIIIISLSHRNETFS